MAQQSSSSTVELSLGQSPFPRRPGLGTSGRRLQARTNHFEITNLPKRNIHQYDVKISPDKLPSARNRQIFEQFRQQYCLNVRIVYDGKAIAFAPEKVGEGKFEIAMSDSTRSKNPKRAHNENYSGSTRDTITLTIKHSSLIKIDSLKDYLKGHSSAESGAVLAINALDVLIRHQPSNLYSNVGRSFYLPSNAWKISGGLEAWQGAFQSVRCGGIGPDERPTGKVFVNVDTSSTTYHSPGNLINKFQSVLGYSNARELTRKLSPREIGEVEKAIKNLKIQVIHRGSTSHPKFKVAHLSRTTAEEQTFFNDQTQSTMSVAEYFRTNYNIRLEFGRSLPCVIVKKDTYIPVEVCDILPGQRYNKKLNPKQTAEMIKFATVKPFERQRKIEKNVSMLDYDKNPDMKEWNVSVSREMTTVAARLLASPVLQYGNGRTLNPKNGAWNIVGQKFHTSSKLERWIIVSLVDQSKLDDWSIKQFVRNFVSACSEQGINVVSREPPISICNPQGNLLIHCGRELARVGGHAQLVVFILPGMTSTLYGTVKKITDCELGIPSQCVLFEKIRSGRDKQYYTNVSLKVNVKLGGVNVAMTPGEIPSLDQCIIFGADINHPAPESYSPSIAAVVGTLDTLAGKYGSKVSFQAARLEPIIELEEMIFSLLNMYEKATSKKPRRIVYYRDGVGEGQFTRVKEIELNAIVNACRRFDPQGTVPRITYIIVQKRHKTRFFPIDQTDADRSGNLLAGTVVETTITHPVNFDFYIQSHAGIQGTSRPAHYYVLHDDNRITADSLQQLTNRLCYLSARCTRAVSIVPPAYYAHLLAYRARYHVKSHGSFSETSSETHSETAGRPTEYADMVDSVKEKLESTLYFV